MVGQILGHPCSHNMSIVVAGFAKVFVGEIVEKGIYTMCKNYSKYFLY
jgi:hypothetical protein